MRLLALTSAAAAVTVPVPSHGPDEHLPIAAAALTDGYAGRWPGCDPIGYQVNLTLAPPGSLEDLHTALAQISTATGMRFLDRGTTDLVPQDDPDRKDPVNADAPLVIAWALPAATPAPASDTSAAVTGASQAAAGEAAMVSDLLTANTDVAAKTNTRDAYHPRLGLIPARHTLIGADVVIDASLTVRPWGGASGQLGLLEHELGHAMGLGHTSAPASVMRERLPAGQYATLGPADVTALRAITSRCRR